MDAQYHNDEPAKKDSLNRQHYATAFADMAGECGTPLAVGIYASWGVGKTSLMKLIDEALNKDTCHVVWFNLWEHQFVENPVLALSHAITNTLGHSYRNEFKKLLTVIAVALSDQVLKATTGQKILEILKFGSIYEEEHFQTRDQSLRLKDHIKELLEKVRSVTKKKRIVFFIDDLDRCDAEQGLKLLESLKLYLNLEGCVFFLGVDREALQQCIQVKYKDIPNDAFNYLDKIIQLPFTVPLIEPDQLASFIKELLPGYLDECQAMLEKGLGSNPRQVKRFINTLLLNYSLAKDKINGFDVKILCGLLLIQYRNPELYHRLSLEPQLLIQLQEKDDEADELRATYFEEDLTLEGIVLDLPIVNQQHILPYIYLTEVAGIKTEESEFSSEQMEAEYNEPVKRKVPESIYGTFGKTPFTTQTVQPPPYAQKSYSGAPVQQEESQEFLSDEAEIEAYLTQRMVPKEEILDRFLLFRTRKQKTWLLITATRLYCLLDDAKTRAKDSLIQWQQPISESMLIKAYQSGQGNMVVDIGNRRRWLYSKRLFNSPEVLEERLRGMIRSALARS